MALLNEINVKGVPHPIVTDDGYYEEMTVGDAEQLVATQFVEDNEPYMFRPTGGSSDVGNRAYIDKIVGGTVAWNQLIKQRESPLTSNGVTSTYNTDGTVTLSGTVTSSYAETYSTINLVADHVYLYSNIILANPNNISFLLQPLNLPIVSPVVKNTSNSSRTNYGISRVTSGTDLTGIKFKANFFDLTQMFGSTIADYIYSLEQSQAGAGVAWFKKLFPKDYYPYNAGELLSVEGLQSHDTVGFNQWDEEWEVGIIDWEGQNANDNTRIRCKNYIPCIDNATYYVATPVGVQLMYYDENKNFIGHQEYSKKNTTFEPMSGSHYMRFYLYGQSGVDYGTTYKNDICINLSWSGYRNGEYEPYEKHSYPLDSSLTLRGIPKLDASNNLYYDGDEYTSDGTVKRKYGIVDLGSLDWEYNSDYDFMLSRVSGKKSGHANLLCQRYNLDPKKVWMQGSDGVYGGNTQNNTIYVKDLNFTDPLTFKEAMQGVMLVYELATPTTETAEPFQHIQIVDDFGTEEFVSTGIVPVGHKTRYPANLRDKLQHLPDLAEDDGYYMIGQSNKQMHLEPFRIPKAPTTDGTYVLKAAVSGGTPTYVWAGVNAESEGE